MEPSSITFIPTFLSRKNQIQSDMVSELIYPGHPVDFDPVYRFLRVNLNHENSYTTYTSPDEILIMIPLEGVVLFSDATGDDRDVFIGQITTYKPKTEGKISIDNKLSDHIADLLILVVKDTKSPPAFRSYPIHFGDDHQSRTIINNQIVVQIAHMKGTEILRGIEDCMFDAQCIFNISGTFEIEDRILGEGDAIFFKNPSLKEIDTFDRKVMLLNIGFKNEGISTQCPGTEKPM